MTPPCLVVVVFIFGGRWEMQSFGFGSGVLPLL